jgi:flagellar biosynthetic protein FliO
MEVMREAAAAAGVLLLLFLAVWWLRRNGFAHVKTGRKGGQRRLECLERVPLGPQHSLFLVRFGGRALLVATSPGGASLLESQPLDEAAGPEVDE